MHKPFLEYWNPSRTCKSTPSGVVYFASHKTQVINRTIAYRLEMEFDTDRIRYREATVNDIESLVSLRIRFLNEQYSHQNSEATDVLKESMRRYFSEAMPSHDFVAWVAEYDGRIIGTSGMVIWHRPPKYRGLESGKLGFILNFYTIPQARRKGIATHLLAELLKEAKSLGLKFLHLNATKDGMNIYRKFGFKEPDDPELVLRL